MIKLYSLGFFILVVFSGCRQNTVKEGYITTPRRINSNKIIVEATLNAIKEKAELILHMKVFNRSNHLIHVNYGNCNLTIDPDRLSIPESNKTFKEKINPGGQELYEFTFEPINSPDFYDKTNYRGDLKKTYFLNLDFIRDDKGKQLIKKFFIFEMSDTEYKNYKQLYGRESKIQLFTFGFNRDSFMTNQRTYLKYALDDYVKNSNDLIQAGPEHYILISGSEIILDNRLINILCSRQSDTLNINLRILNNAANRMKVSLNKFCIRTVGHSYLPSKIISEFFNYNKIADSAVILSQGARFVVTLGYCIPENYDEYILSKDWLLIKKKQNASDQNVYRSILYNDLLFKKDTISIK